MGQAKASDQQISYIDKLMEHTLQEDNRTQVYLERFGTANLQEINYSEASSFITHLQCELNIMRKKSRALIINRLCTLGYTLKNGKPDFKRINAFIENIGSNNPRKVMLNYLYPSELNKVATQVKAMFKKEVSR